MTDTTIRVRLQGSISMEEGENRIYLTSADGRLLRIRGAKKELSKLSLGTKVSLEGRLLFNTKNAPQLYIEKVA